MLRNIDDGEIYLIDNGKKRHFTSSEAFEWNGYIHDDIIEVAQDLLNSFEQSEDISITQAIIDKYNEQDASKLLGAVEGKGEKEAGISAYSNVGKEIDLTKARAGFKTIEKETDESIIECKNSHRDGRA